MCTMCMLGCIVLVVNSYPELSDTGSVLATPFIRQEDRALFVNSTPVSAQPTPPEITCPVNQTVSADESCQSGLLDYTGMTTAIDDEDPDPTITQAPVSGTTIDGITTTTVTMTATDDSGNSSSCQFDVAQVDDTAPTITCPGDMTVTADENGWF